MSYSLTSVTHKKGVLVLFVGTVSIASFPAWLNAGKLPAIDDVIRMCGLTPEGSETIEMTGAQVRGLVSSIPKTGRVHHQGRTICVTVKNKNNGVTAFPLIAVLTGADTWDVTVPLGMLIKKVA